MKVDRLGVVAVAVVDLGRKEAGEEVATDLGHRQSMGVGKGVDSCYNVPSAVQTGSLRMYLDSGLFHHRHHRLPWTYTVVHQS